MATAFEIPRPGRNVRRCARHRRLFLRRLHGHDGQERTGRETLPAHECARDGAQRHRGRHRERGCRSRLTEESHELYGRSAPVTAYIPDSGPPWDASPKHRCLQHTAIRRQVAAFRESRRYPGTGQSQDGTYRCRLAQTAFAPRLRRRKQSWVCRPAARQEEPYTRRCALPDRRRRTLIHTLRHDSDQPGGTARFAAHGRSHGTTPRTLRVRHLRLAPRICPRRQHRDRQTHRRFAARSQKFCHA